MKSLVVYTSTTGNTKAVAEYIAAKTEGTAVEAKNASSVDLQQYDAVYIGSQIHAGKISKGILEFMDSNKDVLAGKKVAYFLCGMFTGDKGKKQLDSIKSQYHIGNCAYFVKGKKLVETGEEIDPFIRSI